MKKMLWAVMLAGLVSAGAQANIVVNGNFNNGLNNWKNTGNTSFTSYGYIPNPHNVYLIVGPAFTPGYISQVLPTATGHPYTLSFDYQMQHGPASFMQVLWDGKEVFYQENVDQLWTRVTIDGLVANFNTASLTFAFRNDTGYNQLDNIYVSPVPEPETYALMLGGLGLVGVAARRRKAGALAA